MVAAPPEVRAARSFLRSKGITTKEVPPRKFASAAKELNKGFRDLLQHIMILRSGGQGRSAERRRLIQKEANKGK